jgi:hypothetical protein
MLEDFWLPRRDGSKGTEISTLPGATNLSDLDDVNYFKEKLYQSLNVPVSRMNSGEPYQLGRSSEIGRDEVKFSKFVKRLRKQFSELFNEILRVQLVLKGVCSSREFEEMRQYIGYDFLQDTYFEELKRVEVLNDQLNALTNASPYLGQYFSVQFVRKVILGQTEEDIARIDQEIMQEIEQGIIKSQDEMQGLPPPGAEPQMESKLDLFEIESSDEINKTDEDYERLMEQIRADLQK